MTDTSYLMFVDIETFGFDPLTHPIIEVGLAIVSVDDFAIIDSIQTTIWDELRQGRYEQLRTSDWVYKTHDANGLFADCQDDFIVPGDAEQMLVRWMQQKCGDDKPPMVGSSVHFDRKFIEAQMPYLTKQFSHRNVDFSTLRELCKRFNPELFDKSKSMLDPLKEHRVMSCIKDSIGEAEFYVDNFLFRVDPS